MTTTTNKRIVFVGYRSGKSSVINRFLGITDDQEKIVEISPVDPMGEGTYSTIEFSRSDTPNFFVQVEFHDKEHFLSVFEYNYEEIIRALNQKNWRDVNVRACYKKIEESGYLFPEYEGYFNKTLPSESYYQTPKEVMENLSLMCSRSHGFLWPIIKKVKVSGPFPGIPLGITLIDTPAGFRADRHTKEGLFDYDKLVVVVSCDSNHVNTACNYLRLPGASAVVTRMDRNSASRGEDFSECISACKKYYCDALDDCKELDLIELRPSEDRKREYQELFAAFMNKTLSF